MQFHIKAPYEDATLPVQERVTDLLARMTLAEKIGQMTQVEKNSIEPGAITDHAIGSVLSGGGGNPTPNDPASWAGMVRSFQEAALRSRLGIPLLYGVDAVHGHNNMWGAVIFPHNIGLGATRDAALVERIGRVTARELLATNVHWTFAPAVSVPRDIRWGRTYEGYSEDPALVAELAVALLRGLQGGEGEELPCPRPVLGSVKHFIGDGGTRWGSTATPAWLPALWQGDDDSWSIDQGTTDLDEATLRAVDLLPYVAAIEAGATNIMVSYSSWGGLKMHEQQYLLTEVLKGELGFRGFLVSDWMAIDQIAPDYYSCVIRAVNAGLDMIMVPFDYKRFISTLTEAVGRGDVPIERIDDAVSRILTSKFELGLFEGPFGDEALLAEVGSPSHREVAREAVRKSLVLLKNEGRTLPLSREIGTLYLAGAAAEDIGLQCGGWTIEWMGKPGPITPGTTLREALQQRLSSGTRFLYDEAGEFEEAGQGELGIVVLSEPPYAEGAGDRADLALSAADVALVERVRRYCKRLVVVLYSGRPLIVEEILPHCDALVAAWLPGSEGEGVADLLVGDCPFTGRLPYTWPRTMAQVGGNGTKGEDVRFPLGYGLSG